jgi:hypothetical protein
MSQQTLSGFLKRRVEIEETVLSSKWGSAVTRKRENDNLRILNMLVSTELLEIQSDTPTIHLIKAAQVAGDRLRMKLLKERAVTNDELTRLGSFKASRPWAKNLVIRLRNDSIKCPKVLCSDTGFGLSTGISIKSCSSLDTRNTIN